MRASSVACAGAGRTCALSEMNDAGVGTDGTYFAIAPPLGVFCGMASDRTRTARPRRISVLGRSFCVDESTHELIEVVVHDLHRRVGDHRLERRLLRDLPHSRRP